MARDVDRAGGPAADGDPWTWPLVATGALGTIVFWTLGAATAATWPGYDPVAQSISSMVHAPLGWLQTLAFWLGVPLAVTWAYGAARAIGTTERERRLVRGIFLLQAAISAGFAILPTDAPGAPTTLVGQLHLLTFYVYAVATPLSIVLVGRLFARDPRWTGAARPSVAAAGLMLAATLLVPLTVAGPLEPWLGLLERVYVGIPGTWQLAISIRALRMLAAHRSAA